MKIIQNDQTNSVKLNILYGVDHEIWYVRNVVKKTPWYLEHEYPEESIKLPNGITKDSNDEDVAKAVKSGYLDIDYAECAEKLRQEWATISEGFKKMRGERSFRLENKYEVVLTKYGTGGNYNTKTSRVIVLINARSQGGTAGIVAHEIVHMTIQHLIDKYNVRHWRKERLVDLLMEHYFPGLKKMQMLKEDISIVDQSFKDLFPDIAAITKAAGG